MTKIGIVNIANTQKNMDSIIPYNISEGFELYDFCDTLESGFNNFFNALNSSKLDFVWFLSGGTSMIDTMNDKIKKVKTNKIRIIGSSDSTHMFIHLKDKVMVEKYYYLNFLDFLKSNNPDAVKITKLLISPNDFSFQVKQNITTDTDLRIVGGHSIICAVHLDIVESLLHRYAYFWEHHNSRFETVEQFVYWLKVLACKCRIHKIKVIIIGYSNIYDPKMKKYYSFKQQQKIARKILQRDFYLTFVDHTKTPIQLY